MTAKIALVVVSELCKSSELLICGATTTASRMIYTVVPSDRALDSFALFRQRVIADASDP